MDEVLPPAFLSAVLPSLPDAGLGVTVVQATGEEGRGDDGAVHMY